MLGVSTDPFDWGAPNLSFSSISSLRDLNPSLRTDQTLSTGDTITKIRGKQTIRFGGDYREHPRRQPDGCERARQLRLHRPLHRYRFRRLPARAAAAGDRAVRPGHRALPIDVVGPVRPGRLARHRQDHRQRRAALRVLLAAVRSRQSSRDARYRARVHGGGAGGGRRHRSVLRRVPRHDRASVPRRLRAARRRRLAAQDRHRRARRLRHQLQLERVSVHRAAAGRPAAVRHRPTPCSATAQTLYPIETALQTRAAGRDHEHLRRRSQLPARIRADLESRRAARSDAHRPARRRLHRDEGDEPRHPARAQPRSERSADSRRRAVHLGVVRRRLDHARADASGCASG